MVKSGKSKKGTSLHQDSLALQLDSDYQENLQTEKKEKKRKRRQAFKESVDSEDENEVVRNQKNSKLDQKYESRLSQKILQQAAQQLRETEREVMRESFLHSKGKSSSLNRIGRGNDNQNGVMRKASLSKVIDSDDEMDNETDENEDIFEESDDNEIQPFDPIEEDEYIGIRDGTIFSKDENFGGGENHAILSSFIGGNIHQRKSFADTIFEKINQAKSEKQSDVELSMLMHQDDPTANSNNKSSLEKMNLKTNLFAEPVVRGTINPVYDQREGQTKKLSPKVIQVFTEVGEILQTYTSGKIPKAFKVIPSLVNWEEILYLTRPDQWSPHATYMATRTFSSNLNEKLAERFFRLFLLEKCREDIQSNKALNYHYYQALKKAIYKPKAFMKGIVLPLCMDGDCTLKEALIFASVISKISIPATHSAVTLMKLASESRYNPISSIFMKTFLNKKYSLPYRVIDQLCVYFNKTGMQAQKNSLPVIWHQSLLVFAQRYKEEITREQKRELASLVRHQNHHQITIEVRRELFTSKCRGELNDPSLTAGEFNEMIED